VIANEVVVSGLSGRPVGSRCGRRWWTAAYVFVVLLLVFAGAAAAASVDRAKIPPGSRAPWSSSRHDTPLEKVASKIASHIAGHQVAVHCDTLARFRALASNSNEIGLVHQLYDRASKRYVRTATTIELSPIVCGPLQRFAEAAVKPTSCDSHPLPGVALTHGPCFLPITVTRESNVPRLCSQSGCYRVLATQSPGWWHNYGLYVKALQTLGHEAIHAWQGQAGRPVPDDSVVEAQAECEGIEWISDIAVAFGDSALDAQTLASYYWLTAYPSERQPGSAYAHRRPYWSASCGPGGPWDVRASGSTFWP
jgi:hypothetical protein